MKKILGVILTMVIILGACPGAFAQTMDSNEWGFAFTLSDDWTPDYSNPDMIQYFYKDGSGEKLAIKHYDNYAYLPVRINQSSLDTTLNSVLSDIYIATYKIQAPNGNKITVTENYQKRRFESYNGVEYYRGEKLGYATAPDTTPTYYYITVLYAVHEGTLYEFTYSCFSDSAPHFGDVVNMLRSVTYKSTGAINYALKTDITATINGHAIPSYNVDGYTYIVAEDLRYYGFNVHFDNASRTLSIARDYNQTYVSKSYSKPYVAPSEVGTREVAILATDIVTYLNNSYIPSCNINGQTIIRFDALAANGYVAYDNNTRTISLAMSGIN